MGFNIVEHRKELLFTRPPKIDGELDNKEFEKYCSIVPRLFPNRKKKHLPCFKLQVETDSVHLAADYYVGVDWLIKDVRSVHVLPKLNTKVIGSFEENLDKEQEEEIFNILDEEIKVNEADLKELNYLKIFMDAMAHPVIAKHIDGLIFIDWDTTEIKIEQKNDILTPFLVVQFLNLLKQIVRKGLKKSYYKVQENLNNRVKGKILVSEHIKKNMLKNRFTKTYCEYQAFGLDSTENRFLKKVLQFVSFYAADNAEVFKGSKETIDQRINYCTPVFEQVSDSINEYELKHIKTNPFFKEYKEAVKIGQYIIRRFAYNISNTSKVVISTPPFWLDMPRLFELYVYNQLLNVFQPNEIKYHYSTYGNELDFLITKEDQKMVIDAKYKIHYKSSHIHEDIRQVSGYARLNKVYSELNVSKNELIDCLIIYPATSIDKREINLKDKKGIRAYNGIYKLGISLPMIIAD